MITGSATGNQNWRSQKKIWPHAFNHTGQSEWKSPFIQTPDRCYFHSGTNNYLLIAGCSTGKYFGQWRSWSCSNSSGDKGYGGASSRTRERDQKTRWRFCLSTAENQPGQSYGSTQAEPYWCAQSQVATSLEGYRGKCLTFWNIHRGRE